MQMYKKIDDILLLLITFFIKKRADNGGLKPLKMIDFDV